jgi:hypothetical protein
LALYALSFAPSIRRMHWSWANTRLSRAAIMLSEVVDTSEVIKRTTYPDPAFARRMAEALDELKLLRPALVRKADIAALLTGAVDDRTAAGWCDAVVASGEGEFRAAGWAALPASGRPADAVLLAYQVPGEAWVPFALSDAMVRRRDIARLLKDQHQIWSGWAAVFPRSAVPENAAVGAWAVDIERPKLYRLKQAAPELKL